MKKNSLSLESFIRKSFVVLTIVAFVAGGLFLATPSVQAATLSVPGDHTTIQAAIDAAADGDTINVAAGVYDEQLVIDKDVTIVGATGAIIQPTAINTAWDIQFVLGGSDATLEGFTLDFNGVLDTRAGRGIGVSDLNGPAVTNVTIQNNDITMGVGIGAATAGLEGVGIQTGKNADVSGLQILNNDFHAGSTAILDGATAGEEGIYINPNSGVGSITISGNTFDGELFTGISVEANNVIVTNNTITRPSVVSNTNGIRVNDFVTGVTYNVTVSDNEVSGFATGLRFGRTTDGGSTLTITAENNTVTGNNIGIQAREDSVVTISESNISGNTIGAEILVGSDGSLNAINNWWGDASGPFNATSNPDGIGNAVGDGVDFIPWCTNPECTVFSTTPTTEPATNITTTDAELNGMNGYTDATGHSFWASTTPYTVSASATPSTTPPGVESGTGSLGPIAANTAFSALLSDTPITITPNTTYYFNSWVLVDGIWYPGEVLSFTTNAVAGTDTTPDAFAFTDQTSVALNTVIESDIVTIAGLDAPADISITGGEYSINGGAYTSADGTIENGNTIRVQHTSSSSNGAVVNTILTIGGVSDTFTSTTLAAVASSGGGGGGGGIIYCAPGQTTFCQPLPGQVLGAFTGQIPGCDIRTTGFSTFNGVSCVNNIPQAQVLGASTGPIPGCYMRTTGFSTVSGVSCVNNVPHGQIQVLGASTTPYFPSTGLPPQGESIPWNMIWNVIVPASVLAMISLFFVTRAKWTS